MVNEKALYICLSIFVKAEGVITLVEATIHKGEETDATRNIEERVWRSALNKRSLWWNSKASHMN